MTPLTIWLFQIKPIFLRLRLQNYGRYKTELTDYEILVIKKKSVD